MYAIRSYYDEARACGVKTAMTIREALGLCPRAILVPPDHLLYHTLSHEMMEMLAAEIRNNFV